MKHLNPTGRFSSRVDAYARYRPSYPLEVAPLLARECGLKADSTVADMGSGTGLLSKLFLDFGCRVIEVEPNADMRQAGDRILTRYQNFSSIDAPAEQTGLPDRSVELVAAGQAFHWFDATAARREFDRILRPPKWVALIWNERQVAGGFLEGYENLLHRYVPDYAKIDHRQIDAARITAFFGHGNWKPATFSNVQELDLKGVQGRLDSSSYAPRPSDPGYEPMIAELGRLFEAHQQRGRVSFLHQTNLCYGTL